MYKSFKQFLEFAGAPSAGGPATMPNAGNAAQPSAPTTNSGASSALTQQSQNLGQQIQTLNQKLQQLMQQKAAIDKQIGQANNTSTAQASTNNAAIAATQAAPGQ